MSTLHTRWCCRSSSAPSKHTIPRQAATRCSLPISTRIVAFSRSLSTDKLLYCSRAVPATTTNALIYSSFAASYINNPSFPVRDCNWRRRRRPFLLLAARFGAFVLPTELTPPPNHKRNIMRASEQQAASSSSNGSSHPSEPPQLSTQPDR